MDKVKAILTNDVIVRAFKTFVQAFVGAWVVFDNPLSKTAIAAGAAAGVSAVWNLLRKK